MKKLTLIAAAAMTVASGAALAQSSVTLYGIVDAGVSSVSGLKSGRSTALVSGIMDGSRFGLKSTEDLGGGYKAIFVLENRLELDTGSVTNRPASGDQVPDHISTNVLAYLAANGIPATPTVRAVTAGTNASLGKTLGVNMGGNLFDRQAYTGLITPFGAFTLGRQYTPGFLVSAAFDASQTQSSLAAGQVASLPPALDTRLSNTLQYGIKTGGVTATLMYGFGEVAGNTSASRFLGGMAMYAGDGYSVGFGHNEKRNELDQKSLTNNVFGATVNVGPGTLYGMYITIKDKNPSGLSSIGPSIAAPPSLGGTGSAALGSAFQAAYNNAFKQDARLMHIGYKLGFGASTVVVAYNRLDDKRAVNADTDSYGFTYSYALSKRTSLNAVVTHFNNKGMGQIAPGGAGYLGGVTSAAGVDSNNIAFGVNHKF